MLPMWKLRELVDRTTNMVMNYTETEAKVREATNDDPWGPSGQQMQEISSYTFTYDAFPEAMGMLWKRLFQEKQNWRRIYKSLLLLDYLIKNGSERVVTSTREHLYDLRSLENYTFVDDMGKDQGINIRHKVSDVLEFIQDDERLREERKKAKKNKDKYIGMSSDSLGFRSGGGGGGWDSWKSSNIAGSRFDSEDEDKNSDFSTPGVTEFKDEDEYSMKNSPRALPQKPSGGHPADITSRHGSTTSNKIKSSKPSKKVDLGAAAVYASQAKMQQQNINTNTTSTSTVNNNQMIDVFFTESEPKPSQIDHEVDDFDPRAGEDQISGTEHQMFGQVETSTNSNNSCVTKEFADFSSAFATQSPDEDLFANFVEPTAVATTVQTSTGDVDLFADVKLPAVAPVLNAQKNQIGCAAENQSTSSMMDLLGGLDFANQGLSSMQLGQSASPLSSGEAISAFSGGFISATPSGPSSLPLQPASALSGMAMPSLPQSTTQANSSTIEQVNIGSTWKNLGNLNNSLLNFSLNPEVKKTNTNVPMNAMTSLRPAVSSSQTLPTSEANHSNVLGAGSNNFSGLDSLI